MKSPSQPAPRASAAALLTCLALGACSTPQQSSTVALESLPSDDGTVVATEGDSITVLVNQQPVKIRLEGFADEGARVAAAVRQSPAHARLQSPQTLLSQRGDSREREFQTAVFFRA